MPAKEAIELAATSLVAQLRAAAHNEEVAATQFSYLNAANLPPSQPTLELRSDWWGLGIVLSVFATFFGTVGKDLFRLASISSSPSTSYCLVTLGLVFTAGIDPIFNIAALAFATQAIVSACGGFVLVWNVLLAPCILSENLTRIRLMASIFILVGTIGVGLTGPHYEIVRTEAEYFELFLQPQSLVYMGLLVAFCALAAWRWRRAPDTDGRSWGAVLGGAVQGSNFFLKAAIAVVQCSVYPTAGCLDHNPWRSWQVYAVIAMAAAAAAGGLLILALALRHSEALDAVTIFTGTQLVFSALSCNIVLNENQMSYSWIIMLYCLSVGVILVGLTLLAVREMHYPVAIDDEELEWYDRLVAKARRRTQEWLVRGVDLDLSELERAGIGSGGKGDEGGQQQPSAVQKSNSKAKSPLEDSLLLGASDVRRPTGGSTFQ